MLVRELKCGNIMRLFQDEFPASDAKSLGTYLDIIPYAKIKVFRQDNTGDTEGMLIDVLDYWLETDPEKSWTKLAEVKTILQTQSIHARTDHTGNNSFCTHFMFVRLFYALCYPVFYTHSVVFGWQ